MRVALGTHPAAGRTPLLGLVRARRLGEQIFANDFPAKRIPAVGEPFPPSISHWRREDKAFSALRSVSRHPGNTRSVRKLRGLDGPATQWTGCRSSASTARRLRIAPAHHFGDFP